MISTPLLYRVLSASAVQHIEPRLFAKSYGTRHQHPFRKATFFTWREGLKQTVRKYRSKRLEQTIEAQLSMVLMRVDVGGASLIALTRHMSSTSVVERKLIFEAESGVDLSKVVLDERCLTLFESYLPVPECPLAPALAAAVLAANPRLAPAASGTLDEAVRAGAIAPADAVAERVSVAPAVGSRQQVDEDAGVFFLGFGSYIREYVMPHFRQAATAACDYRAELISRYWRPSIPVFAEIGPVLSLIAARRAPLVVIASYHSAHAAQAKTVLEANPEARVFIEKPLGVTNEDVDLVARLRDAGHWVDIGYNRRYAPLTQVALSMVRQEAGPFSMTASVKELSLPASHWYFWPNQGSRLVGNITHWLDLAVLFADCEPTQISAVGTPDRASIAIAFENGATVALNASEDGDSLRGVQEHIEFRAGRSTMRIRDYASIEIITNGISRRRYMRHRRKGHEAMYKSVRQRWLEGDPPLYPVRDIFRLQRIIDKCGRQLNSE
jgi:predicted dehydrogenase